MMKFFRKYTKHLLAVFMALLLVIWLAGDALQSLLINRTARDDFERGTLDGQKITQKDAAPVLLQLEVLDSFELRNATDWKAVWASVLDEMGVRDDRSRYYDSMNVMMSRGWKTIDEDEWFLLVSEARRNGVFVPNEAVEEFKVTRGLTGPSLARLRQNFPLKLINEAIRSYLMVQQQAVAACKPPPVSEADIRDFIRQTSEKADVVMATLAATEQSRFFDKDYTPTEDELTKLFEKHKDTASRPHSQGLDFGYQQPEGVRIEYLRISAEALSGQQQIDETFAYDYWSKHRNEFTREVAAQSAPASGPAPAPRREPYATFTEAKADVIRRLQKAKADEAALRIAREIIDELTDSRIGKTTQPEAKETTTKAAETEDAYAKALLKWSAKYPGAVSHVSLSVLERDALQKNPEIGQATAKLGVQSGLSLPQAAFLVEGIADPPEQGSEQHRYFRKPGETCSVAFADTKGNAFIFRTVEIRAKQAPATLDLVRERLINDARIVRAYERAGEYAKALRERAVAEGLEVALRSSEELKGLLDETAISHPTPFARKTCIAIPGGAPYVRTSDIPGAGSDPKLVDAIFAMARDTTTQPGDHVLVWEQPEQRRWLVIELKQILPPTKADYDQYRTQAIAYLQKQRQQELLVEWFNQDQIKTRMKWKSFAEEREASQGAKRG
ncbi:MAG: hypothetical protein ACUVXJ_08560 [Phycisphaerae bacterium]